jgi:hypothetical protein
MRASFTAAALNRLAECIGLEIHLDATSDAEPLKTRIETVRRSSRTAWDINGSGSLLLFGDAESRSATFLGLVELAAASGYVHLAAWEGSTTLARAGALLLESVASSGTVDKPRLIIVQRLISRLAELPSAIQVNDCVAFDAFESYLSLTRSVFADEALIDALHFAHHDWKPGADRAALLTPRHLAEALARGSVGAVSLRGVVGVPRSLEAFEWLVSIVTKLRDYVELRDGILSHAHWSHAAWVPGLRADEWAIAMSEWLPRRDLEGESRWTEFRNRVFLALEAEQKKLGLEDTQNGYVPPAVFKNSSFAWNRRVALEDVSERVNALLLEGRDEAARRTLREALVEVSREMETISGAAGASVSAANWLMTFASRLAELQDLDSAAAFVAPHLTFLIDNGVATNQALQLLANARRAGIEELPVAKPKVIGAESELLNWTLVDEAGTEPKTLRSEAERPKYRSQGGDEILKW